MNTTLQLRIRVWIAASLIAMLSWVLIPLTPLDRIALQTSATWFSDSPISIEKSTRQENTWLATEGYDAIGPSTSVPIIISLEDDADGIFQESPHSPVDFAVIFNNLKRLGIQNLCSTSVLAWDQPDTISLAALEKTIDAFDSSIVTAPLSRGPTPEAMPSAFRAASTPINQTHGNTSLIPVVNRISLPGIILPPKSLAGFQIIDSEPLSEMPYMMARWDDRLVFSVALLATVQHLGLSVDDLTIRMNESIQLGQTNIQYPIDEFGRLKPNNALIAPNTFPAAATIDAEQKAFPENFTSAVFCDYRSLNSPSTRAFNQLVPAIVLRSLANTAPSKTVSYSTLNPFIGLPILITLAIALFVTTGFKKCNSIIALTVICLSIVITQYLLLKHQQIWAPSIAALITTLPAWLATATAQKKSYTLIRGRSDQLDFVRYSGNS